MATLAAALERLPQLSKLSLGAQPRKRLDMLREPVGAASVGWELRCGFVPAAPLAALLRTLRMAPLRGSVALDVREGGDTAAEFEALGELLARWGQLELELAMVLGGGERYAGVLGALLRGGAEGVLTGLSLDVALEEHEGGALVEPLLRCVLPAGGRGGAGGC